MLVIAPEIDIQSSLGFARVQSLGWVSNTFIFTDENVERIGIYSQHVLKPSPNSELLASGAEISGCLGINFRSYSKLYRFTKKDTLLVVFLISTRASKLSIKFQ